MDELELKFRLRKNKLEMEYKDKMQIREVLFLAMVGIPFTVFNIAITIMDFDVGGAVGKAHGYDH